MDLFKLLYPDSQIVQIVFNRDNFNSIFPSHLIGYNLGYPFSMINHLMPNLIFGKGATNFNKGTDLIHYTSHTFHPMIQNEKSVVTIHDLFAFEGIGKDAFTRLASMNIRRNTRRYVKFQNIITASNHIKNKLVSNFNVNEDSISVINIAISDYFHSKTDNAKSKYELTLPANKKLVLSVSSGYRRKNLPMVEAVMTKLGSDFQLVRVGPKVGDSITFGAVDGDTLNKIYNACDVLLFPTLAEGFGLVTTESFATGLPVVSSDIEVIREVAGDSAVLVDPLDVDQNVEGILKAIENKEYYRRKGFERAKLFSRDTIKEQLIRYYRTILE